jgi:SAM-dependent methyltransferase
MCLRYRIMYAVGFVPWDTDRVPSELSEAVDGVPPGRALDVGCGTGMQAVHLAKLGWDVTAVDAIDRALDKARARAEREGVTVDWVKADVGQLPELFGEPRYGLVFDRGCFHDLPEATRAAYVRGVTAAAEPGATLLMLAFEPNRKPGPAGVAEDEVRTRFADGWRFVSREDDTGPAPSGPMAKVPRHWYRLQRDG